MSDRMLHRGPDGSGVWVSNDESVAFAHRRLAIVDLSERGRQPMSYANGRYWITFNGEIYNFRDLTSELQFLGHRFASGSDTEVILAAVAQWGLHSALQRLVGMFAFALWDGQERLVHLARDRMGEKPLYLGEVDDYLFFASELRSFPAIPGFQSSVSVAATAAYLRDGYVPDSISMYKGVCKLLPGHVLTVPVSRGCRLTQDWTGHSDCAQHELRPRPYWSCTDAALQGRTAVLKDEQAAAEQIEYALLRSVKEQMHADVPTGAFLSGGIDSSLVSALMQAQSSRPISTFTVAFDNPAFDESHYARAIAKHLGTQHEEFSLTEAEILRRIPSLVPALDEPTANSSFFPLYLISELARKRVKVVLSGDGGDELFGGYNRYALAPRVWNSVAWIPWPMRRALGRALHKTGHRSLMGQLFSWASSGSSGPQVSGSMALAKFARVATCESFAEAYLSLVSCWDRQGILECGTGTVTRAWSGSLSGRLSQMMLSDQIEYLPGDSLAKVDRASMAVSLETRVPLLDYRLVELSWRLPEQFKLADGTTKRILRSILYRYVPRELIERKKMGFTVPLDAWLAGPLREWASDTLSATGFLEDLPFRKGAVQGVWNSYLDRRTPSAYEVWSLVILAAWMLQRRMQS